METKTYTELGIPVTTITIDENELSTEEQKTERYTICKSCEHYNDERCGSCGCIVHALMTYKTSKCPLNKW